MHAILININIAKKQATKFYLKQLFKLGSGNLCYLIISWHKRAPKDAAQRYNPYFIFKLSRFMPRLPITNLSYVSYVERFREVGLLGREVAGETANLCLKYDYNDRSKVPFYTLLISNSFCKYILLVC